MNVREAVTHAAPFLALGSLLFLATSVLIPSVPYPACIEGGSYVGFPFPVLVACHGAPIPGGGVSRGPPIWNPGAVAVDLALWTIASWGLAGVYRRARSSAA